MASHIITSVLLLSLVAVVAGLTCKRKRSFGTGYYYQYCSSSETCCDDDSLFACCTGTSWSTWSSTSVSSSYTGFATGVIVAIVIAVIIFIAIIVGIIICCVCCCRASQGNRGQVMRPQQPHVTMVSGSTNMAYTPGTAYPGQPTPMTTYPQNPAYPQTQAYPQNPAYPQTPAYSPAAAYPPVGPDKMAEPPAYNSGTKEPLET